VCEEGDNGVSITAEIGLYYAILD